MNPSKTRYRIWKSPVGGLLLTGNAEGLSGLHFQDGAHPLVPDPLWIERPSSFQDVIRQLEAYFAGRLKKFQVKIFLEGTPFQLAVWDALQKIPYGQTTSYGDIAKKVGNPMASRAVGMANGKNPVSIIVPCHRVIGRGGDLIGFGGGLKIKKALLDIESGARQV